MATLAPYVRYLILRDDSGSKWVAKALPRLKVLTALKSIWVNRRPANNLYDPHRVRCHRRTRELANAPGAIWIIDVSYGRIKRIHGVLGVTSTTFRYLWSNNALSLAKSGPWR
jgi:hypothetical protein